MVGDGGCREGEGTEGDGGGEEGEGECAGKGRGGEGGVTKKVVLMWPRLSV